MERKRFILNLVEIDYSKAEEPSKVKVDSLIEYYKKHGTMWQRSWG